VNYELFISNKGSEAYAIIELTRRDYPILTYLIHALKRLLIRNKRLFEKLRHVQIKLNNTEVAVDRELVSAVKDYVERIRYCEMVIREHGTRESSLLSYVFGVSPSLGLAYRDPLTTIVVLKKYGRLGMELAQNLQGSPLITMLSSSLFSLVRDGGMPLSTYKLLDSYEVGPFVITIYRDVRLHIPIHCYHVDLLDEIKSNIPLLYNVERDLIKWLKEANSLVNSSTLNELIEVLKDKCAELIESKGIPLDKLHECSLYLAFKVIGIVKFLPFLLDEHVEEFYLDKPGRNVYLDHNRWGRCEATIRISDDDIEAFLTHIRLEGRKEINVLCPSIKEDLKTKYFHVRVSIDIPPLAIQGVCIDVRRYRRSPFTLSELISLGTLDIDTAAYLLLAIRHRRNILVLGEPGSGKTTLLNALDLCTPCYWRKIYVEDVIESIDQSRWNMHQVKFKVRTYEDEKRGEMAGSSKYDEIIKLLHRTPDYVILGEVQTKDHVKALFHALATGIRGIATTHANDIEGLIVRYVELYDIHPSNIALVDLFVLMTKLRRVNRIRRYVKAIYEIRCAKEYSNILDNILMVYRGLPNRRFISMVPFEERPLVNKIVQDEGIEEEVIVAEYMTYKSILSEMTSKGITSVDDFIQFFNKKVAILEGNKFVRVES